MPLTTHWTLSASPQPRNLSAPMAAHACCRRTHLAFPDSYLYIRAQPEEQTEGEATCSPPDRLAVVTYRCGDAHQTCAPHHTPHTSHAHTYVHAPGPVCSVLAPTLGSRPVASKPPIPGCEGANRPDKARARDRGIFGQWALQFPSSCVPPAAQEGPPRQRGPRRNCSECTITVRLGKPVRSTSIYLWATESHPMRVRVLARTLSE